MNILLKDVDSRRLELSRADTLLKQEVQLCKRSPSWLRHSEVRVDDRKEARACPKEAGVVAPVPCGWLIALLAITFAEFAESSFL